MDSGPEGTPPRVSPGLLSYFLCHAEKREEGGGQRVLMLARNISADAYLISSHARCQCGLHGGRAAGFRSANGG